MINDKSLEDAGYKKHTSEFFEYSDYFYQKKFCNDVGVKYFVEFVKYTLPFEGTESSPDSWAAFMRINGPIVMDFRMHYIKNETIEKIESMMDLFWTTMKCNYYERNQNEIS